MSQGWVSADIGWVEDDVERADCETDRRTGHCRSSNRRQVAATSRNKGRNGKLTSSGCSTRTVSKSWIGADQVWVVDNVQRADELTLLDWRENFSRTQRGGYTRAGAVLGDWVAASLSRRTSDIFRAHDQVGGRWRGGNHARDEHDCGQDSVNGDLNEHTEVGGRELAGGIEALVGKPRWYVSDGEIIGAQAESRKVLKTVGWGFGTIDGLVTR